MDSHSKINSLYSKQTKKKEGYTEVLNVKVTSAMKTKIEQYVKLEQKEIPNYRTSDFLRDSISLLLTVNFGIPKNNFDNIFFKMAVAHEFIPFLVEKIGVKKSKSEAIKSIIAEIFQRDKHYRKARRNFIRQTENVVIDTTIKFVRTQDIPMDLKKEILLKLQKIRNME
jgi:hypothetical protein